MGRSRSTRDNVGLSRLSEGMPAVLAEHQYEMGFNWALTVPAWDRWSMTRGSARPMWTSVTKRDPVEPIEVLLDFTLDVAEVQQPLRKIACPSCRASIAVSAR